MALNHVLLLVVALSGAVAMDAFRKGNRMNTHDPDANLHVTTSNATYSGTKSYNRTESNLNLEGVRSAQVEGEFGCYSLFLRRNFQRFIVTISSGDGEVLSDGEVSLRSEDTLGNV